MKSQTRLLSDKYAKQLESGKIILFFTSSNRNHYSEESNLNITFPMKINYPIVLTQQVSQQPTSIVTEFMSNGTLREYLRGMYGHKWKISELITMASQVYIFKKLKVFCSRWQ